jgi:phosphotransferase system HPr-like phosphotransfer protein
MDSPNANDPNTLSAVKQFVVKVPGGLRAVFKFSSLARKYLAQVEIVAQGEIVAVPKDFGLLEFATQIPSGTFAENGCFSVHCVGPDAPQALSAFEAYINKEQEQIRFPSPDVGNMSREGDCKDTLVVLSLNEHVAERFSRVILGGPPRGRWRVCGVAFLLRREDMHYYERSLSDKMPLRYDLFDTIIYSVSTAIDTYRPAVVVVHMGEAFIMDPDGFREAFIRLRYRFPEVAFVLEAPNNPKVDMKTFQQPADIQAAAELLRY